MKSDNVVQTKSYAFAIRIIKAYKYLIEEHKEYVLSKQLLRSGTSIGANIAEAAAAISKKDFILKMSIASKEARETKYWLYLLKESAICKLNYDAYLDDVEQLIKLLTSIVKTAQQRLGKK